MIALRQCVTDEDYEVWLAVRRAVLPDERAPSLDELKTSSSQATPICSPTWTASSPGAGS
jgi:hypothetical protein